jgi:hypothetical protein
MELFGYKPTMSCNDQVFRYSLFNNRSWNQFVTVLLTDEKNADSSHEHQRPFVLGSSTIQAMYARMNLDVKKNAYKYMGTKSNMKRTMGLNCPKTKNRSKQVRK